MIEIVFNTYLLPLFDWVIETSIMASILVGLILCVKILLRNILTPRWHYLLWMILIVRLLLPWSPDSSYSIYSILLDGFESITSDQSQPISSSENKSLHETTTLSGIKVVTDEEHLTINTPQTIAESKKGIMISNEKQEDEALSVHSIASYFWLTGVIVLGFITYLINRRLQHYMKQQPVISDERIVKIFENCKKSMSIQQNIPLILAGKIPSPTVLGFFRPRVLISNEHINLLSEQQLRHIFYHELSHIKRADIGLNWLMHILLILNWFNPIIWVAYVYMREDQELACDAYALTFMEEEEKIQYGFTIISLLEHYTNFYPVPNLANLSRNKRILKRRILMIKKFKKKSYRWSTLGIMVIVAVASVSLLNANADGPNKKHKQVQAEQIQLEAGPTTASAVSQSEIVDKMLNTIDYYQTISGTYTFSDHTNGAYYTAHFQVREGENPGSYVKITYKNGNEYITRADGQYRIEEDLATKSFRKSHLSPLPPFDKTQPRKFKDSHGINHSVYRQDPATADTTAKKVTFPQEFALWLEEGNFKVTGAQIFVGRNVTVLEGQVPADVAGKIGGNQFTYFVDSETGAMLKLAIKNDQNEIAYEFEVNEISFNGPIDTSKFSTKEPPGFENANPNYQSHFPDTDKEEVVSVTPLELTQEQKEDYHKQYIEIVEEINAEDGTNYLEVVPIDEFKLEDWVEPEKFRQLAEDRATWVSTSKAFGGDPVE